MKKSIAAAICALGLIAAPLGAQNKGMDEMRDMAQRIKEDRKAFVAAKLPLTDAEAKGFWPIYDAYELDRVKVNERLYRLIESYANAYNADSLTDELASSLLKEALAIEEDEVKIKRAYLPRLTRVLPAKKALIYYQVENKIRAQLRYELAVTIPLAR